jgi:serine-type D-Ala-D-Ala carboxypeptidase/endopeptidase
VDIDAICEQVARPYRKRHGQTVAGLLLNGAVHCRHYNGKRPAQGTSGLENTVFEIGSITKTFTAILMCELVRLRKVELNQPIRTLLDGFDKLPDWVTPQTLATHTSGLPRIPDGMRIEDMSNPYRSIGEVELRDWVAARQVFAPNSDRMAYSNLGVGLLGLALGKAAGSNYTTALGELVTAPLGLEDTTATIPKDKCHRLAQPHGLFGRKVQFWDFDALAGCGALKSTAHDLGRYAAAVVEAMNGGTGPLAEAIRMSCEVQLPGGKPFVPDVCLGWMHLKEKQTGTPVFHHDGGTGGSSSTLFICPDKRFAVFALASTRTTPWTAIRQIRADPHGLLSKLVSEAA